MLQKETTLRPVDNAGVRWVKCVKIVGKEKKYGIVGDLLLVLIQSFKEQKDLVKKKIYCGLIISMKSFLYRADGTYIRSDYNRIVMLARESLKFLGTRIYGPIYKEIRSITDKKKKQTQKYPKVVSYAISAI